MEDNFREVYEEAPKQEKKIPNYKAPKLPKNLGRKIGALIVVLLIAGLSFGSFYSVSEQEQAVVTMFGNVIDTKTAGLYFKIPLIQQVTKVSTITYGMPIGYVMSNTGDPMEDPNQDRVVEDESLMITSDFNFVNSDFYLEYRVSDPVKYIYTSTSPEAVFKNLALASIRSTVVRYPVDEVITTSKSKIQADVRDKLMEELSRVDIGIEVVNVSIQDAEPPTAEVKSAFKAVETAKQGAETAVNNANKYQSEQLPAANANADQITKAAEAKKEARIAEAEGQLARFNDIYKEYKNYPYITKKRMFYETLEEVIPHLDVIITDGKTSTMYPLKSFTGDNYEVKPQEEKTVDAETKKQEGGN